MRQRLAAASKEDKLLLIGLPIFTALLLIGWTIWGNLTEFDDIEARLLTWSNIGVLTSQHLLIVVVSALIVVATAVPVGVLLTRQGLRGASPVVMGIANAGQAAPVIGVIVLLALAIGFGFWIAVLSLTIYAFLPVLANTIAGLRGVDGSLIEAARGMGMSSSQVLFRVELPMAVPVIMTGVRTALVLLVGAGAFATFIDAGGLGLLIQTGIVMFRYSILVSGAILVAALAMAVEWVGRLLEIFVRPGGLS
jgi:osmoprotectant transport system permease protein